MFRGRRPSKDIRVTEKMLELAKDGNLWITEKTKDQLFEKFSNSNIKILPEIINVRDYNFDNKDYCFLETTKNFTSVKIFEEVIIFRWKRTYPFDERFPVCFKRSKDWKLIKETTLAGRSHEEIIEEHYAKRWDLWSKRIIITEL